MKNILKIYVASFRQLCLLYNKKLKTFPCKLETSKTMNRMIDDQM